MAVLFADETKSRGYVFGSVIAQDNQLTDLRQKLRSLIKPGQRSIHFSNESDQRRRALLDVVLSLDLVAGITATNQKDTREGRNFALAHLLKSSQKSGCHRLVLEWDNSSLRGDRRFLGSLRSEYPIAFTHSAEHDEPLLWAADAVAWSFQRGGNFRKVLLSAGVSIDRQ
jgi:hypothetical protein